MNSEVYTNLKKMIDVNTPIIYIHDYDFTRVDFLLKQALGGATEIREWSPALGYQRIFRDDEGFLQRDKCLNGEKTELTDVLQIWLNKTKVKTEYLLLRDIQDEIETPKVKSLLQMIAQRKLYDLDFELTIFLNSSVNVVPKEIEKYVSFLEIPYPNEYEIKDLIREHVETNGYSKACRSLR